MTKNYLFFVGALNWLLTGRKSATWGWKGGRWAVDEGRVIVERDRPTPAKVVDVRKDLFK